MGCLTELRILVPPCTPLMACIATAYKSVKKEVIDSLEMCALREKRGNAPRVLVYCRSLDTCADLYAHFHFELGRSFLLPYGSSHVSDQRLVGMFHAGTPQYNKDVILKSLLVPDGVVHVVFATVALGMGVDLRGVNNYCALWSSSESGRLLSREWQRR